MKIFRLMMLIMAIGQIAVAVDPDLPCRAVTYSVRKGLQGASSVINGVKALDKASEPYIFPIFDWVADIFIPVTGMVASKVKDMITSDYLLAQEQRQQFITNINPSAPSEIFSGPSVLELVAKDALENALKNIKFHWKAPSVEQEMLKKSKDPDLSNAANSWQAEQAERGSDKRDTVRREQEVREDVELRSVDPVFSAPSTPDWHTQQVEQSAVDRYNDFVLMHLLQEQHTAITAAYTYAWKQRLCYTAAFATATSLVGSIVYRNWDAIKAKLNPSQDKDKIEAEIATAE